jgi:hypothetical protein
MHSCKYAGTIGAFHGNEFYIQTSMAIQIALYDHHSNNFIKGIRKHALEIMFSSQDN